MRVCAQAGPVAVAYTMSRRISFSFCLTFLMMVSRPMLARHQRRCAGVLIWKRREGCLVALLALSRYRVMLYDSGQEFIGASHFLVAGCLRATAVSSAN